MYKPFLASVFLSLFCSVNAHASKKLVCSGTLVASNAEAQNGELKLAVNASFSLEMVAEKVTWTLGNAFEKEEITGKATTNGPGKPFVLSNDDANPYKGKVDLIQNLYPTDSAKYISLTLTQGPITLSGAMSCQNP